MSKIQGVKNTQSKEPVNRRGKVGESLTCSRNALFSRALFVFHRRFEAYQPGSTEECHPHNLVCHRRFRVACRPISVPLAELYRIMNGQG